MSVIWYRLTDRNSLVTRLKTGFLPPHAEDNIREQIRDRKTTKNESVTIFVAQLENLFTRLPRALAEVTKVKHIRRNLLLEYVSQLALHEIGTVSEFTCLYKRLEEVAHTKSKNRVSEVSEVLDIHDSDIFP